MTQYIGPSLQLATAIFLYNEPFAGAQAVSFMLIWSALIVFTLDQIKHARANRRLSA
jgi:chloramphenicol-sensitive protein RarD